MEMTLPDLLPSQIDNEIVRFVQELENATGSYAEATRAAAVADVTYKRNWSIAYIRAEGPVHMREAKAVKDCIEAYEERRISEGLERASLEKMRSVRDQLSALQTLSRSLRDQV
jgi:hypothetical protein